MEGFRISARRNGGRWRNAAAQDRSRHVATLERTPCAGARDEKRASANRIEEVPARSKRSSEERATYRIIAIA